MPQLFDLLDVYGLSDARFQNFLEGLVTADVQIHVGAQEQLVEAINAVIRECGAELRQTDEVGGYPVFSLVSLRHSHGRPKNLVFSSTIPKPDIRLASALDNEIEIASGRDEVLVYDRAVGNAGLTWQDLQAWWAEHTQQENATEAKTSLYTRLWASLPKNSPPQRLLFKSFFKIYRTQFPHLPALLPEVWLHWDPKTKAARGAMAFPNQRMDFLMLLPGHVRVVIEVDGIHHYSDPSGAASPATYARMVSGDRELQLAGYEVYRFGGSELDAQDGPGRVETFFEALFRRHGVAVA